MLVNLLHLIHFHHYRPEYYAYGFGFDLIDNFQHYLQYFLLDVKSICSLNPGPYLHYYQHHEEIDLLNQED